jgi:hypothetical protein
MDDGVVSTAAQVPGEARTVCPLAMMHPLPLTVPKRMMSKPVVWFNNNVQVQQVIPSELIRPAHLFAFACMTPTASKYLPKSPHPEGDHTFSDIEDNLQVMNTPTSSQQDLGMDQEMADADDEVEIVDSFILMDRISSSDSSSQGESPDIPIDQLSVARSDSQILVSTAASISHMTNISSCLPNPHPAVSLPLEYQDDL